MRIVERCADGAVDHDAADRVERDDVVGEDALEARPRKRPGDEAGVVVRQRIVRDERDHAACGRAQRHCTRLRTHDVDAADDEVVDDARRDAARCVLLHQLDAAVVAARGDRVSDQVQRERAARVGNAHRGVGAHLAPVAHPVARDRAAGRARQVIQCDRADVVSEQEAERDVVVGDLELHRTGRRCAERAQVDRAAVRVESGRFDAVAANRDVEATRSGLVRTDRALAYGQAFDQDRDLPVGAERFDRVGSRRRLEHRLEPRSRPQREALAEDLDGFRDRPIGRYLDDVARGRRRDASLQRRVARGGSGPGQDRAAGERIRRDRRQQKRGDTAGRTRGTGGPGRIRCCRSDVHATMNAIRDAHATSGPAPVRRTACEAGRLACGREAERLRDARRAVDALAAIPVARVASGFRARAGRRRRTRRGRAD